jgi:hydroxymethylpyrimidine kinase/phosphomethylpyrimidine kinase
MKTVLTIAGSDSSGGAGIQADLKTFCAHRVYGMSVITAITAQNTCGVTGMQDVDVGIVRQQLEAVFTDIFPDAVKIGMVSSVPIIRCIAEVLEKYHPNHVVLDPVMVSTTEASLITEDAENALTEVLMHLADIITPNISEAEKLTGTEIKNQDDMIRVAKLLCMQYRGDVLIKGGHLNGWDLLCSQGYSHWLEGRLIDNPNTHGTGCTMSSAIAANLAQGYDMFTSVKNAKIYITNAIKSGWDLGAGRGPINHYVEIK